MQHTFSPSPILFYGVILAASRPGRSVKLRRTVHPLRASMVSDPRIKDILGAGRRRLDSCFSPGVLTSSSWHRREIEFLPHVVLPTLGPPTLLPSPFFHPPNSSSLLLGWPSSRSPRGPALWHANSVLGVPRTRRAASGFGVACRGKRYREAPARSWRWKIKIK